MKITAMILSILSEALLQTSTFHRILKCQELEGTSKVTLENRRTVWRNKFRMTVLGEKKKD